MVGIEGLIMGLIMSAVGAIASLSLSGLFVTSQENHRIKTKGVREMRNDTTKILDTHLWSPPYFYTGLFDEEREKLTKRE